MRNVAVLLFFSFIALTGTANGENFEMGLGFGIPYGLFGANFEFNANDYLSLTAGVGSTIFAGVGAAGGARVYLADRSKGFRPRLSAIYGTNTIIDPGGSDWIQKQGLNLGIGAKWVDVFTKRGFNFDLLYIVTPDIEELQRKYGASGFSLLGHRLKIAFGWGWAF